ncbi:MAG: transcriptional regulator [Caulobacterales bacterium]|nr:transcriptional regulator [Caulobacterales bacterium]
MNQNLIHPFDDAARRDFNRKPVAFTHSLAETGLFSDEALAEQLDRHPADLFDINVFHYDDDGRARLQTGTKGRRPGDELLEAVKQGRVWIQMRRIQDHYPRLGEAIHQAFAEVGREVDGFRPINVTGQLILSAPAASVPYHADPPGVLLFHLRGEKRIWIYPPDETHLPCQAMEQMMLEQQTEDLPYRREMDAAATVFDLKPGMAAVWPLHAPHRIENQGSFNVSLSCDFLTWGARITNGAHYANGLIRRAGGPVRSAEALPMPARTALWATSLGLRRLNLIQSRVRDYERAFELGDATPAPDRGLIDPLAAR